MSIDADLADMAALAARMRSAPLRPNTLYMGHADYCVLEVSVLPPAARPRDYDAYKTDPRRPLLCTTCHITVSRNSPRRWGNPYCGPCWPGVGKHK